MAIIPSPAEQLFKETCKLLFLMFEQAPNLTFRKFKRALTIKVDMPRFRKWMESQGFGSTFEDWQTYYINLQKKQSRNLKDVQIAVNQNTNSDTMIPDSIIMEYAESPQYWWLNVDPETWDIEDPEIDKTKTISFFVDTKVGKYEFEGNFIKWLYCYFIDTKANPHFNYPIPVKEPAISYLNFIDEKIDKNSIERTHRNKFLKARNSLLGNMGIVRNPDAILDGKTYKKQHARLDNCWETDYSNKVMPANRVFRKLEMVDYFYRNRHEELPHKADDRGRALISEPDPELRFNIRSINPFSLAKKGDTVFACSTVSKRICAILEVISVHGGQIEFRIKIKFDTPCPIKLLKEPYSNYCPGENLGIFHLTPKIGKDIIKGIEVITKKPVDEHANDYSMEYLLRDVFIDEDTIQSMRNALEFKKNIIIQGAPGVGKTFLAKRLAFALMGKKYIDRVCSVQFHPNYTYEDFIIGYKPDENGVFKPTQGVFMDFCDKASKHQHENYYFIIDEINRGNLSKIFGEAFTLIENNRRGDSMRLPISDMKSDIKKKSYNKKKYLISVPDNVYIIGLMNTADRSLAMIDIALRRRFSFFKLKPAFDNAKFKTAQNKLGNEQFNRVIKQIEEINEAISKELGSGFCIGHSFFCNDKGLDASHLKEVVEYEIIPLLEEYWFDDEKKVKELSDKLRSALKQHPNDKG